MKGQNWRYDFFIAHAGADQPAAQELYKLLKSKGRIFLDVKDLLPGDNWNSALAEAQRNSFVTVGTGKFVTCNFCAGTGTRDRDGREPDCPVCDGLGGFVGQSSAVPCAACGGTGSRDRDGRVPIFEACAGKGIRQLDTLRTY